MSLPRMTPSEGPCSRPSARYGTATKCGSSRRAAFRVLVSVGLLLIWTLALGLHLFPVGEPAAVSQSSSLTGAIPDPRAMVLPVTTLVLISVASYSRYMRSSALDALSEDYIKAARAKRLPERLVLWRHLVRNACLPMVTLVGLSILTCWRAT